MLKVAVVTRYFPSSVEPWQGRSAFQTLRLVAREVDLRVFYPNASYPSLLTPRSRIYKKLDSSWRPPEVKTTYHDFPSVPLLSRPLNGWLSARVLLPHVRSFAPDVILSCFLYPEGYAALRIGKALRLPTVAMSIGSDINRAGNPLLANFTRAVLRESDFLVTVSEDLRAKGIVMGASPEKSRAIINGCDLSVFHPANQLEARQKLHIEPNGQSVVYIGRMDIKKGLRELVEALASIRPQRPDLQTYLVGEGPDRPIIQAAIEANRAAGYIHLQPACSFDDVAVWIAASDLVTLPSYMEGCPNVVLEALACGRPVVATNVGGIPEIMSETSGRLVPPRDPSALAQAICEVLDKNWDAATISAQRSRSWSVVATELLQVLSAVVSAQKALNTR